MKKNIVFTLALFALCGCMTQSSAKSSICLEIVPLANETGQVLKSPYACEVEEGEDVRNLKMNVDFLVVFRNTSNGTFAFASEEFSFDYYDLSLEIKNEKSEVTVLKKRQDRVWLRNFLLYRYVGPGRSIAYPVTIDYRVWKDIPEWLWQVGRKCTVRAKFVGGYLLEGDQSQYDQHTNVVKLGRNCGELVSEWRELKFRD